jgi:hypothetical protein
VRKGLEGFSHTCRTIFSEWDSRLAIVKSSPRQVGPERVSAEPRKARSAEPDAPKVLNRYERVLRYDEMPVVFIFFTSGNVVKKADVYPFLLVR